MTDGKKLIEMDDKKSHGAKTEGWNIMLKGEKVMFVSVTTQPAHTTLCMALQRWVKM